MLKLASSDPAWVEIVPAVGDAGAVRVKFAPIGPLTWQRALAKARAAIGVDPDDVLAVGDAISRELLRGAILDWENVGDADGVPLPVTPETVALFLNDIAAFEAADRAFVVPWINRDREKNVSSGSPTGTSVPATPDSATATSYATGEPTGDASPGPTAATSATAARTMPAPPKRPRAKASGLRSPAAAGKPGSR